MAHHTPQTCGDCGNPALATPLGLLLETRPHTIGLHRPDGSTLREDDFNRGERGHRTHLCPDKAVIRTRTLTDLSP